MKRLLYAFFALLFNLSRAIFPLKRGRVAFVSMHNEGLHDSLGAVMEEVKARGYETVLLTRRDLENVRTHPLHTLRFFFVGAHKLATAEAVYLNDNFMPMGSLRFRREVAVIQLWHAEGVFKKFGLSMPQPPEVRAREIAGNRKLSLVVCSSKAVASYYAEAFGVSEAQVRPLGAPRADRLLRPGAREQAQKALFAAFPALAGKRLVLYAPTFRDADGENAALLKKIDPAAFRTRFGEDAALLVRLHPQIHPADRALEGAADVTDFDDVPALVLACDALITDYSSICMDFALLEKPCVFFAFDLERYKASRDFYFDYASYVPGPVVTTFADALDALSRPADTEKLQTFRAFNFDYFDCESAKRAADLLEEAGS